MSLVSRLQSAAIVATLTACGSARADLLGITLNESPDIFSAFIDVTYDATTDVFTADGFSLTFDDGSGEEAIADGHFNITATIADGGVALGGSLTIEGSVDGYGPLLLSAVLDDFGFMDPPGGDLFDFLFTVTAGDLAEAFGGIGATIGVILDANNGADSNGLFNENFNNYHDTPGTGQGVADTGAIPGPSALALLALGLVRAGRRRQS